MYSIKKIDPQSWRKDLPAFEETIKAFHEGKVSKKDYKSFSGRFGSYSQRDGKHSMLRLRMTAGEADKNKLNFAAEAVKKYGIDLVHFTTCQTIQLHNLDDEATIEIMSNALNHDIVTLGGGGDYPRNVMCSPLSGVDPEETFDVMPYAKAASEYLMHYIDAQKMPRKLKVAFSNSPKNDTHATFRDLGFVAKENGKFDVYAAGGLGNQPKLGVKVIEDLEPQDILYPIRAMWLLFIEYGNYDNRAKARTRFMQETLGGPEKFAEAFQNCLKEVYEKDDLKIPVQNAPLTAKKGDGSLPRKDYRIIEQKQPGLFAVKYHPIGGSPDPKVFMELAKAINEIEGAVLRLAPDETSYIINLTGDEANRILDITQKDAALSDFETTISCIGASVCQVGIRDSQSLLKKMVEAARAAHIKEDALPQMHISGCPSSCGTHQVGSIGFRGFIKMVDKKPMPGFMLFINGEDELHDEKLGEEVGVMLEDDIPKFIVELGQMVEASQKSYSEFIKENPNAVKDLAQKYI